MNSREASALLRARLFDEGHEPLRSALVLYVAVGVLREVAATSQHKNPLKKALFGMGLRYATSILASAAESILRDRKASPS